MAFEFFLLHDDFLSTTSHTKAKFEYRRNFRDQLERLRAHLTEDNAPPHMNFLPENVIQVEEFKFLPLVTKRSRWIIDLEITLLTDCEPGCDINHPTGDIDNYVKAILDGLRMAQTKNEVRNEKPLEDEKSKPFLCLTEDDQVVRGLKVTHHKNYHSPCKKKRGKGSHVFALIKVTISEKYCL